MWRILNQMFHSRNRRRVGMPERRNDFVGRPAAAQRLVECDKAVTGKPDHLGALLFQGELLPLRVEDVEKIGQAPVVTFGCHLCRLARGVDGDIQAAQALPVGTIGGVGFVHLLDGDKYDLLVSRRKLMRPQISNLDQGIKRAEIEDRGADRRSDGADPGDRND